MTKQTTILITILTIIALGILCLVDAYGQERTEIYEHNNIENKDLGGNKRQLTITNTVSYKVYEHGDTLINVSDLGIIKEVIKGKSNQQIIPKGNGSSFEQIYNIDADSFFSDLEATDFDVSINTDTVFFRKDGKLIATKIGLKVFDDLDNLLVIDKIEKVGKKIKYKYSRPDKTKKAKIDPTWSWTGAGNDGQAQTGWEADWNTARSLTTGNLSSTEYQIGVSVSGAQRLIMRGFGTLKLTDLSTDTMSLDSAKVDFFGETATGGGFSMTGNRSYFDILTGADFSNFEGWLSGTQTYTPTALTDVFSDVSYTAGYGNYVHFNAAGLDSIDVHLGDSLQMVYLTDFDVSSTDPSAVKFLQFSSSADAGAEPVYYLYYTYIPPVVVTEQTGILRSPLDGTIVRKKAEGGTIKQDPNYP